MAEPTDAAVAEPRGKAASMGAAVWKGLNSPIILFLLSSVALTGITRFYTDRQAAAQQAAINRAEVGKLLLELEFRMTRLHRAGQMLGVIVDGKMGPLDTAANPARAYMIQIVAAANGTDRYNPTASEFKDTHIISLLQQIDLRAGTSDSNRRVRFEGATGLLVPHGPQTTWADETPLEAGLSLGEAPLLPNVDPPYLRRAMADIDVLQVYLQHRRRVFLCAADAPGRQEVLDCQDNADHVEDIRLGVDDRPSEPAGGAGKS